MSPLSVLKWLIRISRFGLAALFLFTAGAKLAIVRAFAANVAELLTASGFDYRRWMWPVTIAVIIVELITAVLLLVPRTVRVGALFAAALLLGFAGYALYYVYVLNGEPLECGCFGGIIGSQLGVKTALRNLFCLDSLLASVASSFLVTVSQESQTLIKLNTNGNTFILGRRRNGNRIEVPDRNRPRQNAG